MSELPQGRVASWDGLRGIAILLVLVGHGWEAYGAESSSRFAEAVEAVSGNASFGVRLFFVLSGFLITQLLLQEQRRFGEISLSQFYLRRSLRIFPAFYTYLIVIAGFVYAGVLDISNKQLLAAATYTWNYAPVMGVSGTVDGGWYLGHLWTLSLEEQFYLVWPLTLIGLGQVRARWLTLAIPVVLPIVRVVWYFAFPDHRGYLGMMFHTAIDSIVVGCALAMWKQRVPHRFDRISESRLILVAALLFVFVVSPLVALIVRPYRITLGFLLDAMGAGVLILHATRQGMFQRILSTPSLAILGRLSYSIYLWQQLFLTNLNSSITGRFPLSVGCAIGIGLLSHYVIEMPFLSLKRHFSRSAAPEISTVNPCSGC